MKKYELYDFNINNIEIAVTISHFNFKQYNSYKLYMLSGVVEIKDIPSKDVRLDDIHVIVVLEFGQFFKKKLTTQ